MRHTAGVILPMGAACLLAACGSSSSSPAPSSAPAAGSVTVKLAHVPMGKADLTYDAAQKQLTVVVTLTGLAPSSGHPAHIHSGSCESQGGVAYPLNALTADAQGTATSTTVIHNLKEGGIPDGTWYVNVHNGPGLTPDDQFLPIACGDVANGSKAASVTVPLENGPPPPSKPGSPDEHASGSASLALSGGTLTVTVDATGLEPGSAHAAHIHMGSCESQGPVVYPLDPLRADSSGAAHETKAITAPSLTAIPSGTWYVNVHRSLDLTTQTGFDPIICGNVSKS